MSEVYCVRVEKVDKRYHRRGAVRSLRSSLSRVPQRFGLGAPLEDDLFFALKDVSFSVKPGQAFGIIGPNGAGKTTMLRLLSGITRPTSGKMEIDGRVAAIIELGAGFHPELSGRENIYLYASILGMKRQEVKAKFDEILAFSELEEFLDMSLKHFSSGMYIRLAFSVAACLNPDVLLIDEVLAVGDASFQTKSLRRIRDLKDAGTAIIFVSHNLHQVRVLCDQAMLLSKGEQQAIGESESVVAEYLNNPRYQAELKETYQSTKVGDGKLEPKEAEITRVSLLDSQGNERSEFKTGESLVVRIEFNAHQRIDCPTFTIAFYSFDGTLYAAHQTNWDGFDIDFIHGKGMIEAAFDQLSLLPGGFLLSISISDSQGFSKYDWHQKSYRLFVMAGQRASGMISIPHRWQISRDSQFDN